MKIKNRPNKDKTIIIQKKINKDNIFTKPIINDIYKTILFIVSIAIIIYFLFNYFQDIKKNKTQIKYVVNFN